MRFLFVHQNFPGQYVHVARHLARAGHEVSFITQPGTGEIEGIRKIEYRPAQSVSGGHAYLHELESSVENGLAVARVCRWLDRDGYVPDIVIGHNGWGEILYVKDVWPQTPLLGYFEFFYRSSGSDIDFDAEFPPEADIAMRLRTRNALNLLGLNAADWGQTPTRWQQSQYPQRCRDRIAIVHEGIDTAVVKPDTTARLWLRSGTSSFARARDHHLQRPRSRALSWVSRVHAGTAEGASRAARSAGADCRRRWRQLRPAAARRLNLPRTALRRVGGRARHAARTFSRTPALPTISDRPAGLQGACLSDIPVRTLVVIARSNVGGLLCHRLAHAAGRGSDQRRGERTARRLLRSRPPGRPNQRRPRRRQRPLFDRRRGRR